MPAIDKLETGSNVSENAIAGKAFVTKIWNVAVSAVTKAYLKRKRRKILHELDDHLLRDIGVNRHDIDAQSQQQKDLFKHIGW